MVSDVVPFVSVAKICVKVGTLELPSDVVAFSQVLIQYCGRVAKSKGVVFNRML